MAVLIPTERATTNLANSRTKDTLRMLEKKYPKRYTAETTGVYTQGPAGWDHVVDRLDLGSYMPELNGIKIVPNHPDLKGTDKYAVYAQNPEMIKLQGSGFNSLYGLMAKDEELTHAARLRLMNDSNSRSKKSVEHETEFYRKNPNATSYEYYVQDPEEIVAHAAKATGLAQTRNAALDILDKAYNARSEKSDLINAVMNNSKLSPVKKLELIERYESSMPTSLGDLDRRISGE